APAGRRCRRGRDRLGRAGRHPAGGGTRPALTVAGGRSARGSGGTDPTWPVLSWVRLVRRAARLAGSDAISTRGPSGLRHGSARSLAGPGIEPHHAPFLRVDQSETPDPGRSGAEGEGPT